MLELEELNRNTLEDFFALMVIKREANMSKIRRALSVTPNMMNNIKLKFIHGEFIREDIYANSLMLTEKGEEKLQVFVKEMKFFIGDYDDGEPKPSPEPDYRKIKDDMNEEKRKRGRPKKIKTESSEEKIETSEEKSDEVIKAEEDDDDKDIEDEDEEDFTVPEEPKGEEEIKEPMIIFTDNPEEYDDNVIVEAEKHDAEDDKEL